MKKRVIIFTMAFFSIYMFGCAKKDLTVEEPQEPLSMEELTVASNASQMLPSASQAASQPESQNPASVSVPAAVTVSSASKLGPLPPAGPYKPTLRQIQIALKNAGYYFGAIDGKIGPLTRGAIEKFQKANGLKADGKVGPKTWGILLGYLNPPGVSSGKKN